jgi:hypothetical protein
MAIMVASPDAGVFSADIIDGADVRVIQRGSGLGFSPKAAERLRIFRKLVRQKFQRDEAIQPRCKFPSVCRFSSSSIRGEWITRSGHSSERCVM